MRMGPPCCGPPSTGLLHPRGTVSVWSTLQEFPRKSCLWKDAHFHDRQHQQARVKDTELHFMRYSHDISKSRLPTRYRLAKPQKPQSGSQPILAGEQSRPLLITFLGPAHQDPGHRLMKLRTVSAGETVEYLSPPAFRLASGSGYNGSCPSFVGMHTGRRAWAP